MKASALFLVAIASGALAAEPPAPADVQNAELDSLRAEVASQLQLQAYDLLDEVVFDWTQHPLFATPTPVVLGDVTVPLTLGSGFQALLENHFSALLLNNPKTQMTLVHCPQCTALLVHSGAKGTVVSRGVDAPEALAQVGAASGSRYAIFIDFEAEGGSLVLRVRITHLTADLPIVFAKTLSTANASPALLRAEDHLVSAAEARKEYLDALERRGLMLVPLRLAVRSYMPGSSTPVAVPPFVWAEIGVEFALTQARAWTGSLSIGYTWAPSLHDGFLAQTRISRLISGQGRSLTHPDVYVFGGLAVISVQGSDASLFSNTTPDVNAILASVTGNKPTATFGAWQVGLEMRVKDRIAAGFFLESMPTLGNAPALGAYLNLLLFQFQSIGAEVSFCF